MKLFLLLLLLLPTQLFAKLPLGLVGSPVQGGMLIGTAPKDTKIFLDGLSVPLADSQKFIIGFGRNQKNSALLELKTKNDSKKIIIKVHSRKYDIQYIDGIDEKKVIPPPSAWPRIKNEIIIKRKARNQKNLALKSALQKFTWPLSGQISGVYGSQRVLNSKPKRPHYGIDIASPPNKKITAPASGVITLAENDLYFEGGLIFLDHGLGLSSAFLHLGTVLVRVGQKVKQGEIIALSGNSGRSTGSHLDWRIKWLGHNLDPAIIVSPAKTCVLGLFVVQGQATCYETKASFEVVP